MIRVGPFPPFTCKNQKRLVHMSGLTPGQFCATVWVCEHDWSRGGCCTGHFRYKGQAGASFSSDVAFLLLFSSLVPLLFFDFPYSLSTLSHFFSLCFLFLRMIWSSWGGSHPALSLRVIISGPVVVHCGSKDAFIKHLYSSILGIPFFFLSPLLSTLPRWVTSLPLSSLTPLLWPWPWPCPPWVIYHGPGVEPPGLQAPVSPCNRLFVAPSKQVSDQQKSIKAWWAFLSQLGSGHWAALLAAPRALCVAAVRWHRSPQD